jgi:Uncharacterised protein family (UPF0158)
VSTKLSDLVDAFETQGEGITQYLDRETGHIALVTEDFRHYESPEDTDTDLPEWMQERIAEVFRIYEEPDRYLELPSQNELVNHQTLRSFCHTLSPPHCEALLSVIHGKGTFRRFNDKADELGVLPAWFVFRRRVLETLAIQWCEENGIVFD